MGAESSKLAVQDRFDELGRRPGISKDDTIWTSMLSPTASNVELTDAEFFGMITIDDLRRIRTKQPDNFELLFLKCIERLEGLTRVGKIGTNGLMGPQISNCCRILTRLAPVLYEGDDPIQIRAEDIHRTVDVLKALLHYPGYTMPLNPRPSRVWYSGIGCPVADSDSAKYNKQRIEVIRALLSILGSNIYTDRAQGLDYFTGICDDPVILSSLLNTSLASNDIKLASLSLCLVTISLVHMGDQKNQLRRLVAKLHNLEDLEWLGSRLKQLYESNHDKIMSTALIWEIVQANSNFSSSCDILVPLAEVLAKDIISKRAGDNTHEVSNTSSIPVATTPPKQIWNHEKRLIIFTLLTMTAQNSWCARAVGPQILSEILAERNELVDPSIELATLVDVLWNCAPSLILTDQESQLLNNVRESLEVSNPTVYTVINSIYKVLLPRNPSLGIETDLPKSDSWSAVEFQWNSTRFRWYQSLLWGYTYKIEPRVWSHTEMKLFKIAEQKQQTPAVEFFKAAASKFINS